MKYSMHKEEVRNLLASAMVHPATVIVEQLEHQEEEIKALEAEKTELMAGRDGYEAGMRFQFDRAEDYKAQRDEARAKVADWEHEEGLAEIANTQINLHYAEVAKNRELTAQLAEARAEIDRLRPAAEAFFLAEKKRRAAARARAAKVTP